TTLAGTSRRDVPAREIAGRIVAPLVRGADGAARHPYPVQGLYLSNRVEQLRQKLRPVLAELGTNAVAQHDHAVTDLQRRIASRLAHLKKHLLAPAPSLAPLSPG